MYHLLNPALKTLARSVILESGAIPRPRDYCENHACPVIQEHWNRFVSEIPECAAALKNSMDCIRTNATQSSLITAIKAVVTWESSFSYNPMIDGPGGLIPDVPARLFAAGKYVHIPIISGSNLDEGTVFAPRDLETPQDLENYLKSLFPEASSQDIDKLSQLYPDVPAAGSPFNTGNNTFGMSSQYKRAAAIAGDSMFIGGQRRLNGDLSKTDGTFYAYRFSVPEAALDPSLGVAHSAELDYVYGNPKTSSARAIAVSKQMVDYWISFATSLNPNDGRGLERPQWPKYQSNQPEILELHSEGTKKIVDNFRAAQIDHILKLIDL
ncbi:hypothetical protein HGRIS_009286 [Hohenbuehelia grisea]|uniref:Carboxylesterase type B domain-containing protein n=1 Tax=Hohenbuehelia grisea TaxID=104357 RepID=A0ABR3J110_9AGAR